MTKLVLFLANINASHLMLTRILLQYLDWVYAIPASMSEMGQTEKSDRPPSRSVLPQNRTSTQSSLPSLVVARPVDEFSPNRGRGKGQSHPCRSLKPGPIGACLIRASLSLFRPISHKRLVLMRFLRSLASEKSIGLQDHTTSPSASASFVCTLLIAHDPRRDRPATTLRADTAAATASRPAFVTIASRPSVGRDSERNRLICVF